MGTAEGVLDMRRLYPGVLSAYHAAIRPHRLNPEVPR